MIALCIVLLVLGIVFLMLEMWLPGVEVFAAVGLIALLVSAVLAVLYVPGGWFIVAGQALVMVAFFANMYRFMKKKQLEGKLILTENLDVPQTKDFSYLVGREGKTLTALRPSGEADFNGVRVEVTSYGPMIGENTKISVIETDLSRIVVRQAEQ
ncbi:MAG: hypothetical protein FWG65_04610 [Turicibacter sp.]|nr:hypothetical protein [Turicibacter sp.]